jgi:hypothetical protein
MSVLFIFLIVVVLLIIVSQQSRLNLSSFGLSSKPDAKFHNSKLIGVLLGLEKEAVEELLALYKKEFGKGAAR